MDASSIAKKPIEVYYIYSSEKRKGGYGPPIVSVLVGLLGRMRRMMMRGMRRMKDEEKEEYDE